jgi:hypothetical protein
MWLNLIGANSNDLRPTLDGPEALSRRRLNDPHGETAQTLEPGRQGLGFLGPTRTWPGLALIAIGAAIRRWPLVSWSVYVTVSLGLFYLKSREGCLEIDLAFRTLGEAETA